METLMKVLQRPVTTLKDSQRLGRWDRLKVYLSDRERPWKTTNDWQWVSLGTKAANLSEDFERPSTTMNNPERPPTAASDS